MSKRKQAKIVPLPQYYTRSPTGKEQYSRLPQSLIRSDAVRTLKHAARSVYIDMIDVAAGHPDVIYTQEMAHTNFGMSKGCYTVSIQELVDHGLIERMPRSWYAPARFAFSTKWKEYIRD